MSKAQGYWFAVRSRFTDCYLIEHSVKDIRTTDRFEWGGDTGCTEDQTRAAAEWTAEQYNSGAEVPEIKD